MCGNTVCVETVRVETVCVRELSQHTTTVVAAGHPGISERGPVLLESGLNHASCDADVSEATFWDV